MRVVKNVRVDVMRSLRPLSARLRKLISIIVIWEKGIHVEIIKKLTVVVVNDKVYLPFFFVIYLFSLHVHSWTYIPSGSSRNQ